MTSDNARVAGPSDDTDLDFDASQILAVSITGGAGDDRIVNDTALPATLDGGDGNDTITGGSAADVIYGRGADRLLGGLGSDRIYGNGGRDNLFGGGGNDRLYGGASADSLYGQNGSDELFREGGDDRLFDDYQSGLDTLHGGPGNDLPFVTRDGVVDQVFGDSGTDTASADSIDVLTSIPNRNPDRK